MASPSPTKHARLCCLCCSGLLLAAGIVGIVFIWLAVGAVNSRILDDTKGRHSLALFTNGATANIKCSVSSSVAQALEESAILGFFGSAAAIVWLALVVLFVVLLWTSFREALHRFLRPLDYETPPLRTLHAVPSSVFESSRVRGGCATVLVVFILLLLIPYSFIDDYYLQKNFFQLNEVILTDPPDLSVEVAVVFDRSMPCKMIQDSLLLFQDGVLLDNDSGVSAEDLVCTPAGGDTSLAAAVNFTVRAEKTIGPVTAAFLLPRTAKSVNFGVNFQVYRQSDSSMIDVRALDEPFDLRMLANQALCLRNVQMARGIGLPAPTENGEVWANIKITTRKTATCLKTGVFGAVLKPRVNAIAIREVNTYVFEQPAGFVSNVTPAVSAYTSQGPLHWLNIHLDVWKRGDDDDLETPTLCFVDSRSVGGWIITVITLIGSLVGVRLLLRSSIVSITEKCFGMTPEEDDVGFIGDVSAASAGGVELGERVAGWTEGRVTDTDE